LESSFLPQARKINILSQAYTKKQIPQTIPIETSVRPVTVIPQLTKGSASAEELPVKEQV
jgi:hypothetical protein